jgi:hypothetical protein
MGGTVADVLRGSTEQKIGNALVVTIFFTITVVLVVWAVQEWRRHSSPDLAVLLIGSLAATLNDAQTRLMSGLQSAPVTDHPVYYRAFDITISPYMTTAFPAYIGAGGYLAIRALQDRWHRRRLLGGVAALCALEIGFELLAINAFDLYEYTGNQPYKIFGLPPVWSVGFTMVGVLSGALIFLLGRNLQGVRRLLLIPIPAAAYAGTFGFLSWPIAAAVHSSLNKIVVELVSLTTLGIMVIFIYLLTTLLLPTESTAPADPSTQTKAKEG